MFLNHYKIFKKLALVAVLTFSILSFFSASAQDPAIGDAGKGQELFDNNCSSCHAVHEVMVGPALKDVRKRRDIQWIIDWVHNPAKKIASGDAYAVKLAADYKSAGVMTAFAGLSDQQIKDIIAYTETVKPPVKGTKDNKPGDGVDKKTNNSFVTWVLVGFILVLALMVVALVVVINVLRTQIEKSPSIITEESKYLVEDKITLKSITSSTGFRFTVAFFVIGLIGKTTLDSLMTIGIQQGYAPAQPVPFSHKLHAGQYKIDCNYCHTGVRLGKQANIPSANICMNCHSQIKTESPKLELVRQSYKTGQPIAWTRVHNLPDLAYFNHSQHVKVAGLECQKCHGPIQDMEVVQQYSPLTMGWCINCHRETVVKTNGNKYYDKLVQLHNSADMKVKDIGGLECSKCHY